MNKILFFIAAALALILSAFAAGQSAVDALENELEDARGNRKIDILLDLSEAVAADNSDKSLRYAENALMLSEESNYRPGLTRSYLCLGIAFTEKNDFENAVFSLNMAYNRARKWNLTDLLMRIYFQRYKTYDKMDYGKSATEAFTAYKSMKDSIERSALDRKIDSLTQVIAEFETERKIIGLQSEPAQTQDRVEDRGSAAWIFALAAAILLLAGAVVFALVSRKKAFELSDKLEETKSELIDMSEKYEKLSKIRQVEKKTEKEIIEAEKRLQSSNALLVEAIETMNAGLAVFDKNDNLILWNSNFVKFYGVEEKVLKEGAKFVDLVEKFFPGDDDACKEIRKKLHEKNAGEIEVPFKGAWYQISERPVSTGGFVCLIADVSELKKSQTQLSEKEANLQTIINNAPLAIWSVDKDFVFRTFNKQFKNAIKDMTGVEIHPGDKATKLGGDSRNKLWMERYARALQGDMFTVEDELIRNGEKMATETKLTPVRAESGEICGIVAISTDVTETRKTLKTLRRSEQELKELNETKDKLFSIVSHDLKNPFNYVLQFSARLAADYSKLNESDRLSRISELDSSMKQMYILLENLLNWSKAQLGKISANPEIIDLKEIVESVVEIYKSKVLEKELHFEIDAKNPRYAFADYNMLKTGLRNLVSNAVKFSNRAGRIRIATEFANEKVRVRVSDSGEGIPTEELPRIFEIGYSRNRNGDDGEEGSGIGLALSRDFARRNGGDLTAESVLGEGSVFTISIPAAPKEKIAEIEKFAAETLDNEMDKSESEPSPDKTPESAVYQKTEKPPAPKFSEEHKSEAEAIKQIFKKRNDATKNAESFPGKNRLLKILTGEFDAIINELKSNPDNEKARETGIRIQELGEKYNVDELAKYGELICFYAYNPRRRPLVRELEKFEEITDSIRAI